MPDPQLAPVRPRVIAPDLGEVVLLEDEISKLLEQGFRGHVCLVGQPGMGKRTALSHLKAVFGDEIQIPGDPYDDANDKLSFGTRWSVSSESLIPTYWMPPWSHDDFIEYLLAVHPDRCASVMKRIYVCPDLARVHGVVALCRVVLDEMAIDDACITTGDALRAHVMSHLQTPDGLGKLCQACLEQTLPLGLQEVPSAGPTTYLSVKHVAAEHCTQIADLFLREPLITLLAAEQVLTDLAAERADGVLKSRMPEFLVQEVGARIERGGAIEKRLRELFYVQSKLQPMIASLLHAMGTAWRPGTVVKVFLPAAYLGGCQWQDVLLPSAQLGYADLREADLSRAYLPNAVLHKANLAGAKLCHADLTYIKADKAELTGADLSGAHAARGKFDQSTLVQADLSYGTFDRATFLVADLRKAKLQWAVLDRVDFTGATFAECDLTGASLYAARLPHVDLHTSILECVDFENAALYGCNLEGVEMPDANFRDADLEGANLTASRIPCGDFRRAELHSAYLADIDWEGADLRGANLRRATFHMGSARSGLVDSPYASEGTRTGFYTDDYNDQDYKPPEAIRKANLRGADLRGADIRGVDFYLVDLRDARYDPDQEEQLRRTGAILEHRQMS